MFPRSIVATIFIICNAGNAIIAGADPLAREHGKLVFSTLLYRHGDRSIENTYPTDKYANKSYWPMGFGQLTNTGIVQHYELGLWLRKRYSGWLPEIYFIEDVYVRSSDYDRTIMSAEANLIGLYPPMGATNKTQLIPIHTVPKLLDNVLAMSEACPLYSQELEKIENDEGIQEFYSQFTSTFEYIYKNADPNMTLTPIVITTMLYQSIIVESNFNYTLPKWTKQIFPEPLTTIVSENYKLSTYNDILKRLKSGPLLKKIITHMNDKKSGSLNPNRKLWIYSAHDTTLCNLLNTMRVYNNLPVPYASVLMIELRSNNTGNYVVTVSYRNTSTHEPYLLKLPGCDSVACDLDQFTNVLKPFLPNNWDTECKVEVDNFFSDLLTFFVGVITAIVILIILYLIAMKITLHYRKQSYYHTF